MEMYYKITKETLLDHAMKIMGEVAEKVEKSYN